MNEELETLIEARSRLLANGFLGVEDRYDTSDFTDMEAEFVGHWRLRVDYERDSKDHLFAEQCYAVVMGIPERRIGGAFSCD